MSAGWPEAHWFPRHLISCLHPDEPSWMQWSCWVGAAGSLQSRLRSQKRWQAACLTSECQLLTGAGIYWLSMLSVSNGVAEVDVLGGSSRVLCRES